MTTFTRIASAEDKDKKSSHAVALISKAVLSDQGGFLFLHWRAHWPLPKAEKASRRPNSAKLVRYCTDFDSHANVLSSVRLAMRSLSYTITFLCFGVVLGLGLLVFSTASTPIGAPPPLKQYQDRSDAIVIEKSARRMVLLRDGEEIGRYRIRLGFSPTGAKSEEGDGKTPEGTYSINRRNDRSRFHLSLGINYPLPAQRAAARQRGVRPGGDIFIHGQPNRLNGLGLTIPFDWTDGCIAVSNKEIEEIFSLVAIGTKVTILP